MFRNNPRLRSVFSVEIFGILIFALLEFHDAQSAVIRELRATGEPPKATSPDGTVSYLYKSSHALLMSESAYLGISNGGWKALENTASELDDVAEVLRSQGFDVERVSDANSSELRTIISNFTGNYGHDADNRLLFFFSGHGYTDPKTNSAYVVPIDARDPNIDPAGFYSRALPLLEWQTVAQTISVRHALFLFDSCFSGGIFATKASPARADPRGNDTASRWAYFHDQAAQPVRQFIAAGGPKDVLPGTSKFVPFLIHALNGRASSRNDGYVTGKEIGFWIEQTLPSYSQQNPHSDWIRDSSFIFGDMIFQYGNRAAINAQQGFEKSHDEGLTPTNYSGTAVPKTQTPRPASASASASASATAIQYTFEAFTGDGTLCKNGTIRRNTQNTWVHLEPDGTACSLSNRKYFYVDLGDDASSYWVYDINRDMTFRLPKQGGSLVWAPGRVPPEPANRRSWSSVYSVVRVR